jgi:hypothetical protein
LDPKENGRRLSVAPGSSDDSGLGARMNAVDDMTRNKILTA